MNFRNNGYIVHNKVVSRCLSLCIIIIIFLSFLTFDGRYSVVVGILAYYARGRGFDSRTVQKYT
jgi:hypothetical protein